MYCIQAGSRWIEHTGKRRDEGRNGQTNHSADGQSRRPWRSPDAERDAESSEYEEKWDEQEVEPEKGQAENDNAMISITRSRIVRRDARKHEAAHILDGKRRREEVEEVLDHTSSKKAIDPCMTRKEIPEENCA